MEMTDTPVRRERSGGAGAHVLAGALAAGAGLAAFLAGREALAVFLAVVLLVAYGELRRILAPSGGVPTLLAGGVAVLGALWIGYEGRLEWLPWVGAGLVLLLLVLLVAVHEVTGKPGNATDEVAATLAAAAIVGLLGAHVLLIRSVPNFGFGGLLALALMVFLNDAFGFFGGRLLGRRRLAPGLSPDKTWSGFVCGLGASVVAGGNVGLWFDPPFDVASGVAFGVAIGVLAPVGDLAFSALKRSAGVRGSGRVFGAMGGALDAVDGLLFTAPAFYWAFRTIAL